MRACRGIHNAGYGLADWAAFGDCELSPLLGPARTQQEMLMHSSGLPLWLALFPPPSMTPDPRGQNEFESIGEAIAAAGRYLVLSGKSKNPLGSPTPP